MATKKNVTAGTIGPKWDDCFKAATIRSSFNLGLSQSMIEFLCATADNLQWDRGAFHSLYRPDNWIATEAALVKRGLVVNRRGTKGLAKDFEKHKHVDCCDTRPAFCGLTPAGKALVELFKVVGIFVEADAAVSRRTGKGAG